MRAGKPGTETSAPNTSLNPPLNPNSLMPLTLTWGCCCQLLLLLRVRQLLHLARHNRRFGPCLCGDARKRHDVFRRRPAWRCTSDDLIAPRSLWCCQPALFSYLHRSTRWAPRVRRSSCLGMRSPEQRV